MPCCDAGIATSLEAPKAASGEACSGMTSMTAGPRPQEILDTRVSSHVIVARAQPKTRYCAFGKSRLSAAKGPFISAADSPSSVCQPPEMT